MEPLMVESAVPHGAQVRKGDVLLTLDTEKLDRAIADLRNGAEAHQDRHPAERGPVAGPRQDHAVGSGGQPTRRAHGGGGSASTFSTWIGPFALKAVDFSLKVAKRIAGV